jgi:glycosyltransferase involved in cell wall biosynthesis
VPADWLTRLRDAAYATRDTGTVTPLSNDASICSYPDPAARNPAPDAIETARLDRMALAAAGSATIDIPVGVGFCLYIRRDCLNAVGALRDDVFAQGYGEENDFCLRARRLGWRHVALPSVFVAHHGGQSFNLAGTHLRARNAALLERLHPGYHRLVQDFVAADPLRPVRRRLDLRRWRRQRTGAERSVILITHADAGGVERRVRSSVAAHGAAGLAPIILRPAPSGVRVCAGPDDEYPNLRFTLPQESGVLLRFLRANRPMATEVHHFLDHHPALHELVARFGVPYDVHIHDYAWLCPRVLLVNGDNRYCGEPELAGCTACIADHGRLIAEDIDPVALRARSARFLGAARQVIAPSRDTADRIRRHFPDVRPDVVPHEDDRGIPARLPRREGRRAGQRRVCVLGAIGVHKGFEVLLACARDAAQRDLNLEFVVVGSTIDDPRLLATGRVFITGTYEARDAVELILAQDADLGFLPSIAPETWCMGLTELWRAGLRVAVFDIGAPAERIRNTGRGFLLPPHLPPGAINNALVNAMASSVPDAGPRAIRGAAHPALPPIVEKGP